jgi:predicted phosphoribosyltransferase
MYFTNRAQAGMTIAEQLDKYRYENCVVVALSDGAVLVAEPIAQRLHSVLALLLTEEIGVPGEDTPIGTINQDGGFAYNSAIGEEELDEYKSEYFNYFEAEKLAQFHKMNQLVGDEGIVSPELLKDHNIILVSDGLKTGASLDAAAEFLKPIRIERLIVATPIASVAAVDRMHILADEIHCLGATDNYLDTDHYYDENTVPSRKEALDRIRQNILNWQ